MFNMYLLFSFMVHCFTLYHCNYIRYIMMFIFSTAMFAGIISVKRKGSNKGLPHEDHRAPDHEIIVYPEISLFIR